MRRRRCPAGDQDVVRLAAQSIWERQRRTYLVSCARELRPELPANRIERADWVGLCKLFEDLRGIGLNAFPSFEALDTLQFLGNACRHGDGLSAAELSQCCPDLWRPVSPMALPVAEFELLTAAVRNLSFVKYLAFGLIGPEGDGPQSAVQHRNLTID